MKQNIKTFEEFKKIYTSEEFQKLLKESLEVKKTYRNLIIVTLIWGIPDILIWFVTPLFGIIIMLLGFFVEYLIFGKKTICKYTTFYRTKIPQFIAKASGIDLKTVYVSPEEFFADDDTNNMSPLEIIKTTIKGEFEGTSKERQYEEKVEKNIEYAARRNRKQFRDSKIIDADEYYANNICQFIHNETSTRIDFYYASAFKVKEREYEREDGTHTERRFKHLSSGVVFSFENLKNIVLKDFRILIKDDDTLISHLTENTVDNFAQKKDELKFNRIDLNKSFDLFVYADNKDVDMKIEALKIVTPVVEDLIAYIRKKYGRFNMAINNNKIDIELLDTSLIGGNKKRYKNIIIKPKIFSNRDLKISYLYRFYELIEIQKLILKYLNCFPEKYLITEEDIKGLREAVQSEKMSNYEMDMSVETEFRKIMGGV